ncbi:MAG: hypothetical protein BZY82_00645 [SAR202 cluster bacterium Io17-Chloro-G3]|nr:MAG: hypothetical protein BZY82_00645 [SAR202 cluster bacterium Io17-Chloro-G3]
MKLLFYNDFVPGVLKGENVVDITNVIKDVSHVTPQDWMSGLISNFDQYKSDIETAVDKAAGIPVSQIRLRSPLPKPVHMVCMVGNYLENGALKLANPLNAFLKSSSSVIGNNDTVVLPPDKASIFHHEAELGIVVGNGATDVNSKDVWNHIFGYVNFIDVSARGLHPASFLWGKSWDTFGPIGPYIVTADEVADAQNLSVKLWVNGELRQNYTTADMGRDIPDTFEWVTTIASLTPGDIIACGTNHQGLSALQDGDKLEIEIADFGKLTVFVKDDLKREWPRGVDQATADRIAGRTQTGGFGAPAG